MPDPLYGILMLLRSLASILLLLSTPLSGVAEESDTPAFVQAALDRLADEGVVEVSRDWPKAPGRPEVCQSLYRGVPGPQDGAMDGNRVSLIADL